jgi:cyclic pyranopterin phosphate synthase
MIDRYGRIIDYLRISITDRCNLRCLYCMPTEGVEWRPHREMLSFEEILRLCALLAGMGIRKVKVTGGEPLVRRGVGNFIRQLASVPGIEQVTLTSNGLLLESFLAENPGLPLGGINVSLDTLDPGLYARITRRPQDAAGIAPVDAVLSRDQEIPSILRALDIAEGRGIPVKLNCVPLRGLNEAELPAIAALAKKAGRAVRFIELMPLGSANALEPIPGNEVAALLERVYGKLGSYGGRLGNGPAGYFSLPGFSGKIGFINALSEGFCENCNRLRLSSGGVLMPCLSSESGTDLRYLIRSGVSEDGLRAAVMETLDRKPGSHNFSERYQIERTKHESGMYCIGG